MTVATVQGTGSLTGVQKVALTLMQLDKDNAAALLSRFSETEAAEITAAIMQMQRVAPDVADAAIAEVHDAAVTGRYRTRGGKDIALGLLEASLGSERAAGVMSRAETTMAGQQFDFLDGVENHHVVQILEAEHPQTIALVLAHLRPQRAAGLLAALPEQVRPDIARRIAATQSPSPEAVAVVADAIRQRTGAVLAAKDPSEAVGGLPPLVNIINHSDKRTETSVLDGLDELDPELAEQIRSQLLTFMDVVHVDDMDLQRVLRGVDATVLAVALKGAPQPVVDKVRQNISARNAELLDEEMARPVRLRSSQVEDARAEVVSVMREMEAAGELVVNRDGEDGYVD